LNCFTDSEDNVWNQTEDSPIKKVCEQVQTQMRFDAEEFCPNFDIEQVDIALTEN
jgi:hypothetical protein